MQAGVSSCSHGAIATVTNVNDEEDGGKVTKVKKRSGYRAIQATKQELSNPGSASTR
jgi:hypothetical protein